MAKNFTAAVDEWVQKSQARMLAIAQTAIQSVIDDAQTPVAKGGRMRINTGFLRASGQASLNGFPTGPEQKPAGAGPGSIVWAGEQNVTLVLMQLAPGDSFFFGWTANYAKYREAKDAFLDLAVQRWQEYVNAAVAEAKRRIP
jgi:hypothetical protein